MQHSLRNLLTGVTVASLAVGALMLGPTAQAATPASTTPLGAQLLQAGHGPATKVQVRWHTDKLYFYPASKKQVLPVYGQPSGLYAKYTILEKHGAKTLYKKTINVYRALYFAGRFDIDRHYKNDATLVKVTKHYLSVSDATAKAYVKNVVGLPQDSVEVREYLVQNDVLYTRYDVDLAVQENPNVDVTALKPEKTGGYNGGVTITAIAATDTSDAGYQLVGTDTDDNYTYTYNSLTRQYTEGTVTP